MTMSDLPVIVAVDGSDHSLRALQWAASAARAREAEVLAVHVWPLPPNLYGVSMQAPEPPPEGQDPVIDGVKQHFQQYEDAPEVRFATISGEPSVVIPELGSRAQLLVLGSRGRGGFASLLLGSNGRAAAAHARCPVIVVPHRQRGHEAVAVPYGPVTVGLDPEQTEDEVLHFAFREASRRRSRLQVITTHPVPFSTLTLLGGVPEGLDTGGPEVAKETVAAQRERLRPFVEEHYPEVAVEPVVAPGDAAGRLVTASESGALLVVGRHRRRLRPSALVLGSVSNAVLLHSRCPVAVVPAAAA